MDTATQTIPDLIAAGALLIDVRMPHEFLAGHITGADNIPLNEIPHEIGKKASGKSMPIIVYCHSGIRSESARNFLTRAGYTQVINGGGLGQMRSLLG